MTTTTKQKTSARTMRTVKYAWKHGSPYSKYAASSVARELEGIRRENGGTLTPESVVEAARSDDSLVLHRMLQWDNDMAAESWRKQQARQIVGSITITFAVAPNAEPVRAYQSLRAETRQTLTYHATQDVVLDEAMRGAMLARALSEAQVWAQRYRALDELAGVFAAIRSAKNQR